MRGPEATADDEQFDISTRGLRNQIGVISQREIEKVVRGAEAAGTLSGPLTARVTVAIEPNGVTHIVAGAIETGS